MKLSVIVATRNRACAIRPCLDSIAAAFAKATIPDAEIVVVDNGSTDGTPEIIAGWAAAHTVPVQALIEPRSGKGRALNRALRVARGEMLAFTDDDCRLHPDYVGDLLRHAAGDAGELVLRGGRIELGNAGDLALTINTGDVPGRWSRALNSARHDSMNGKINGCNMTMRRALVERLGLFDEDFGPGSRIGSGDDTEYLYRAYVGGAVIEYVPDMAVFHHHGRNTAREGWQLWRRYVTGNGAICVKYLRQDPNLCRHVYWDIKNAVHELISGSNTFLPEIGFSHRDRVRYTLAGALKYFFMHKAGVPRREQYLPAHKNRAAHETFAS